MPPRKRSHAPARSKALVKYVPRMPTYQRNAIVARSNQYLVKRTRGYGISTGQRYMGAFPASMTCVMKYCHNGGIASNTTQNTYNTGVAYSLNNISDPSYSYHDYAVQGYNQLKSIYGHYKCVGALVKVTATNPSQDGLMIGYRLHDSSDSSDILSGETVTEAGLKVRTWQKPINDSGDQVVLFKKYFDIKSVEGLTKLQFKSDFSHYCGTMGTATGPSLQPWFEYALANTKDTTAATIDVKIQIEYFLRLWDREMLTVSNPPA